MKDARFCALCDELIESHDTIFMNGDMGYLCDAQMTLEQKRQALRVWLDKALNEDREPDTPESL